MLYPDPQSDHEVKVTDLGKNYVEVFFLDKVFRGKVKFRQATLSCGSSYEKLNYGEGKS